MTKVNNCFVVFQENHALRELYLSHNKFQELGGEIFADGLGKCLISLLAISLFC